MNAPIHPPPPPSPQMKYWHQFAPPYCRVETGGTRLAKYLALPVEFNVVFEQFLLTGSQSSVVDAQRLERDAREAMSLKSSSMVYSRMKSSHKNV